MMLVKEFDTKYYEQSVSNLMHIMHFNFKIFFFILLTKFLIVIIID